MGSLCEWKSRHSGDDGRFADAFGRYDASRKIPSAWRGDIKAFCALIFAMESLNERPGWFITHNTAREGAKESSHVSTRAKGSA